MRYFRHRGHSPFWYAHRISLFWARYGFTRREAIGYAVDCLWIAVLLGIYGVMGRLDYEASLVTESIASEARAKQTEETLLRCLNGKPTGLYTSDADGNQTHIICDRAWELKVGKP